LIEGYTVAAANQEHGIISRSEGAPDRDIAQRFPIGSLLRILPNHACATGAQHSCYHLVDGRGQISQWGRFSGW
jgi:D-serine deaminase-like pyridoxal phosphate-dependent protein